MHVRTKHRKEGEGSSTIENPINIHTDVSDLTTGYEVTDVTEGEGRSQIHSFIVKIEEDSEEEEEGEAGYEVKYEADRNYLFHL